MARSGAGRMGLRIGRAVAVLVYWVATRVLLLVALAFTSLYFILNAGPLPARLTALLRSALPGTIELSGIQVSPIPWKVDLHQVRITTPDGHDVIRAGTVRTSIDLGPLVRFLSGKSEGLLDLRFSSVRLSDFEVDLDFPEGGRLRLVDAFVPPSKPHPKEGAAGDGTRVHVTFSRIVGERGAVTLRFPHWDLRVTGVAFDTLLTIGDHGQVHLRTRDLTFQGQVGHIRVPDDIRVVPREIPMLGGQVLGFELFNDRLSFDRARITFAGMDLDASGRLAFPSGGPLAYSGRAQVLLPAGSPITATGTAGVASGAILLDVEGEGDSVDPRFRLSLSSPDATIAGLDLDAVSVSASGGRDENGAYAFRVESASAHPAGGRVEVRDLVLYPFGPTRGVDGPPTTGGTVLVTDVDATAVLLAFGAGPPAPPAPFPTRVSGSLQVSGRLGPGGPDMTFSVDLEGQIGAGTVLAGRAVSVRASGRLGMTPPGAIVSLSDLLLRSGADVLRARGTLDLGAGTVDARVGVEKDVSPLLAGLGLDGDGVLSMTDFRVRGPLSAPSGSGTIRAAGLRLGRWEVGEAEADVIVAGGTLKASRLRAQAPFGQVLAEDISAGLSPPGTLFVRHAVASGLDLSRLPPTASAGLRGRGEVVADRVELLLSSVPKTLKGSARAVFSSIGIAGRTLTKVEASATARDGRLHIERARASVRGGGTAEASGWIDLRSSGTDLALSVADVPLAVAAGGVGSLSGKLAAEVRLTGRLQDPGVAARASATGVAFGDVPVGKLSVSASREPGGDLRFSSDEFIPKLSLDKDSRLTWDGSGFDMLVVAVHADRLTPQDLFPSIRQRDLSGEVSADLRVALGLGAGGALEATFGAAPGAIALRFMDRQVELVNRAPLVLEARRDGTVSLSGLALDDGQRRLEACGVLMDGDGRSRLWVRGEVGLYWLRALKGVFSVADGYVRLAGLPGEPAGPAPAGCDPGMAVGDGVLRVEGTFVAPGITGSVTTDAVELVLRASPEPIRLRPGGRLEFRPGPSGSTLAAIPDDGVLRGTLGDGSFAVRGAATLSGLVPDRGELQVRGSGLRISSPGQFFVVLDPDLSASFAGLGGTSPEVAIRGEVMVTDGSYYRNFDVLRKAFSGVARARVAEREGPPLASVVPWLAAATLDVAVQGSRLGLRSRFPVVTTDLELGMDLEVRGTIEKPELWNRLEVLPGGKVTYDVVRREFEVVRGTLDFRGDPGRPLVDVTARTRVQFRSAAAQSLAGGHAPDLTNDAFDEDSVPVTLKLAGEYPNLDISLSSTTSELDQTDLQYLLLTGMTRRDAAQGLGSNLSIPVLTDDVASLARQLLLAPFVDAIRLGVTPGGAVNAEVMAHLGSRLRFETQVLREQGGGGRYTAGFQMRLTDRLSLDGRVRAVDQSVADPNERTRLFESKLRYRIPLD